MNNTSTIFAQNQSNFQILSVCNYILNLSIFLCNKDLVKFDQQNYTAHVPNILFEYLHKSKDESEKKLQLLRETMKKSDFYKNETLCIKYVNETFHDIISKDPFFKNIACFTMKKNDKLILEGIEKILNDILKIFTELKKDTEIVHRRKKRADDETNGNPSKRMRIDNELNSQPIHVTDIDNSDYLATIKNIVLFKKEGISFSMRNYRFKKLMFSLALNQKKSLESNNRINDLWYIETTKSKAVVSFLLKLKGKNFHFNDITLLTKRTPVDEKRTALQTEIRYHLHNISSNGFVDLHKFYSKFIDDYITFPNVFFHVDNTFLTKKVLNIELTMNMVCRVCNFLYPSYNEENLNKRMLYIRSAAEFMTINVPLHTIELSQKILMNYILRKVSLHIAPSYNDFVKDYYDHMTILPKYNDFEIMRNRYIDDVLFKDKLDDIKSLNEAKIRINDLYDNHNINIEEIFNFYTSSSLYYTMRFEDYYVLFLYSNYKNFAEKHIIKERLLATFYRLGLKQSSIKKKLFFMFRYELFDENILKNLKSKVNITDYYFVNPKIFYEDKNSILEEFINHPIKTFSKMPTILQIQMSNQVGLANVDFPGLFPFNVITSCLKFEINNIYQISMNKTRGWYVEMVHYKNLEDEKILVCMANELNKLLSMPIKYYSDL